MILVVPPVRIDRPACWYHPRIGCSVGNTKLIEYTNPPIAAHTTDACPEIEPGVAGAGELTVMVLKEVIAVLDPVLIV